MKLRLQTLRAYYPRASYWRVPFSVTPAAAFSDSFSPTGRAVRNIRRRKGKLRLTVNKPGRDRNPSWRVIHGYPWKSDARPSQASLVYKRVALYRRRPR